tara:strand:+ start:433 stop:672 length:240 start_codon:yes stop_codon:yes gene_type:complete
MFLIILSNAKKITIFKIIEIKMLLSLTFKFIKKSKSKIRDIIPSDLLRVSARKKIQAKQTKLKQMTPLTTFEKIDLESM